MKVAILTDIHGNVPALQAVLADIDLRGEVEHTFCLGDMIGIGPYSNEVIEMLYSRKNMIAISGNHEEAVLSLLQNKGPLEGHKGIAEHHEWIGQHLNAESIKKIQALPKFVEKEVEGHRFLLTHYHMNNDKLDVIDKEPSGTKLDTKYQGTAHDLVCFGHYHILHYYKTDQRVYMNPGALGCNDLAIARYGIVDLQEGKVGVKFIGVPYDNLEYLKSYERLNVPDRAFLLKAFHGNQLEREDSERS